jgi:predicted DNA-binding protein with PD1-like motif
MHMVYSFDGFNYLIRLDKGEQLATALQQFAQETKIEGAWVNGLGGALQATLGFYDLDTKSYQWREFEGLREVASLTGNLARDEAGELVIHLHAVLGDNKFQTVSGHLKDLTAGATLELFIHRAYQPTKRKMDDAIGLKTLDL